MNLEAARRYALSLPEVTEEPHFEWGSWRVRGKIFATIPTEGDRLHIFLDDVDSRDLAANAGEAIEELWWGKKLRGVRVFMEGVDEELVLALLERAWRRRAPKRLVASFDESLS